MYSFSTIYTVLIAVALCSLFSCIKANPKPGNSASKEIFVYQADPTVFLHNGKYYLYGTNDLAPDDGFLVYTSSNAKDWQVAENKEDRFVLKRGLSYGSRGFWAPQVWSENNKFYMAYTADEHIAIATASSPKGPFTVKDPVNFGSDMKNIDPFVFTDSDGKKYLFHVDISNGNKIYVAEISHDYSTVNPETRKLCLTATEPWETIQYRVVEGPTVIKHNQLYYMLYSANDFRSQEYGVGYATATHITGPWIKYKGNPILSHRNTDKPGSGHGDLFFNEKGEMYYVFHTHNNTNTVTPRKTASVKMAFLKDNGPDKIQMVDNSFTYFMLQKK